MKKKIVRLTESDLHRIVENSVKKILKEAKHNKRLMREFQGDDNMFYDDLDSRMDNIYYMMGEIPNMSDDELMDLASGHNVFDDEDMSSSLYGAGREEFQQLMDMAREELSKRGVNESRKRNKKLYK